MKLFVIAHVYRNCDSQVSRSRYVLHTVGLAKDRAKGIHYHAGSFVPLTFTLRTFCPPRMSAFRPLPKCFTSTKNCACTMAKNDGRRRQRHFIGLSISPSIISVLFAMLSVYSGVRNFQWTKRPGAKRP